MNSYTIYLKGGQSIPVHAVRIDFPDTSSEMLQVHISENETNTDLRIRVADVAAVVRDPKPEGYVATGSQNVIGELFDTLKKTEG